MPSSSLVKLILGPLLFVAYTCPVSTPENARKQWYRQNALQTHALNSEILAPP